jgi:transposase-like protein
MTKSDPFKGFQSSPEIIRLTVMLYVRFPLSLRTVQNLLHEPGINLWHEAVVLGGPTSGRLFGRVRSSPDAFAENGI